jgi:hypothetical protein
VATTTDKMYSESDPRQHMQDIKGMLDQAARHCREKIDDPKAQALFETTAEVLKGLMTAYDHFEHASEPAFRR